MLPERISAILPCEQGMQRMFTSNDVGSAAARAGAEGHRAVPRVLSPWDENRGRMRAASPSDAGSVVMQRSPEGAWPKSAPGSALVRQGGLEGSLQHTHRGMPSTASSAGVWSHQEAMCPPRGSSPERTLACPNTARTNMAAMRDFLLQQPRRCTQSAVGSARYPVEVMQSCRRRPSSLSNKGGQAVDNVNLTPQVHSRQIPEVAGSSPSMLSMPASPQVVAWRESSRPNVQCNLQGAPSPVDSAPMFAAMPSPVPVQRLETREHAVHLPEPVNVSMDQQRQVVTPFCPQPPEWMQMQDATIQALREELQACRMAVQAEALERSNAVAQVERTFKAVIIAETEERKASIGALHADLRVTDARLHELLNALEGEKGAVRGPDFSIDLSHVTKSRPASPQVNNQSMEQVNAALLTPRASADPMAAAAAAEAEAEFEASSDATVLHQVTATDGREVVKVPKVPCNEPSPAHMGAVLLDELAMTVAELHADLLDDLKGTLKTQLKDMQSGLWHALEHEMSERKQFENRTIHSFETLKESLQAPLDEMQEDLAKRARQRAQRAWEQFASSSTTTTSPAEMVAQAALAARSANKAPHMEDAVPMVPLLGGSPKRTSSHSPPQLPLQEPARPTLHQVSMEETVTCVGGDGAAGPRNPIGFKVDPNHPKHPVEPVSPSQAISDGIHQEDPNFQSLARSASDPSGAMMQPTEALNAEAQMAPQTSRTENGDLSKDRSWRERYQEINRRIESGRLNQAEAVELGLRALSVEEAPGVSRPMSSDRSLRNTLISNITGSSLDYSDFSSVANTGQSIGFAPGGQVSGPSRYLLRRSNDGPEVTATAESSP